MSGENKTEIRENEFVLNSTVENTLTAFDKRPFVWLIQIKC